MAEGPAPLLFIALAFLFAGFIKGAIGIGLPTVVMGLLSIVMPPAQAAALMVLPAIATNIWQMAAGPALAALLRRFAWMIVAIFIGTFATIGLMTKTGAFAQTALGIVLAAYGAYGLFARRFEVKRASERWLSPLIGLCTGMLSGATGVFVIPTVPYLTSIRMNSEELVQSIGITAFVCPLALDHRHALAPPPCGGRLHALVLRRADRTRRLHVSAQCPLSLTRTMYASCRTEAGTTTTTYAPRKSGTRRLASSNAGRQPLLNQCDPLGQR